MKSFVVFSLVCVLAVIASGESDKTFQYSEKVPSTPQEHLKVVRKNIEMLEDYIKTVGDNVEAREKLKKELLRNQRSIPLLEQRIRLQEKLERQEIEEESAGIEIEYVNGIPQGDFIRMAEDHWEKRSDTPWSGQWKGAAETEL